MMISMKKIFLATATIALADAFAPPSLNSNGGSQSMLYVKGKSDNTSIDISRRQVLERVAASGAAFVATPQLVNADPITTDAWAVSIQTSTSSLSQSLGHALLVIDGMNSQARRLGSSPHPAHSSSVLDGMNAQARRLTTDLDRSVAILSSIKMQAKELTPSDESFEKIVGDVSHASSVLDGLLAQSKRLVSASSSGGSTDDQIVYMLSILDGLNAQARRLDVKGTFSVLDDLNARAAKQSIE